MTRHEVKVEVLGPWSLATSKAFWEGFVPAALTSHGPSHRQPRNRHHRQQGGADHVAADEQPATRQPVSQRTQQHPTEQGRQVRQRVHHRRNES